MTQHNLIRQAMIPTKTTRLMQITLIKQIRTTVRMDQQKIQSMRQLLEIKTQIKPSKMIRHQSLTLTLRLIQMA